MDYKKFRKKLGRFVGWLALKTCSLIIRVLPMRYIYAFAGGVAFLGYYIAGKQRKIALHSLSVAFGKEKSASEIEKIAKDCFSFMAKSGVEVLFFMNKPRLIDQRFSMEGKENLDRALSKGKGVILISAHFGNFPLMLAKISIAGYPTSAIMRPMRDPRTEKIFSREREKLKIKTIYSQPRNACVGGTIEALRNNELVFIPVDQNFGTAGVFVDFFGRKAATATGPVIFAQRTKAAIVPCFTIRNQDDTHRIVFEPELDMEKGSSPQETIIKNIQKITDIIECYIRRHPAEWGWIHRRWKTQEKEV
ncbi:MAG TPA: lysophospholipid acyltransferase family protein [Candidatus Margulisiibacteriota bacterium]|nr:lysophospholipid acyltransferase family protein [Candidatus Margulisiibacteriota bacterium]